MNWEDWFKLLLTGACTAGFAILSLIIASIKDEIKSIWAQISKREDELQRLGIRIASDYVTKMELNEIKRDIKSEMESGFNRISEQIKLLSHLDNRKDHNGY